MVGILIIEVLSSTRYLPIIYVIPFIASSTSTRASIEYRGKAIEPNSYAEYTEKKQLQQLKKEQERNS
ncbi:MAG: hypothetical protein QM642_00075 [Edaphocola sp.]